MLVMVFIRPFFKNYERQDESLFGPVNKKKNQIFVRRR